MNPSLKAAQRHLSSGCINSSSTYTIRAAQLKLTKPALAHLSSSHFLTSCSKKHDYEKKLYGKNFVAVRQFVTSAKDDTITILEQEKNIKEQFIFNDGRGRSLSQIINRIACLQLILARWGIEAALKNGGSANRVQGAYEGISQAALLEQIKENLTAKENSLLLLPIGGWTNNELVELNDRWEELGIFQWCLGIQESVPPYFDHFDKSRVFTATRIVPGQPQTISHFLSNTIITAQPRNQDEIKEELMKAEIWNWRSQAQELMSLKDMSRKIFGVDSDNKDKSIATEEDEEIMDYTQLPPAFRRMIDKLPQAVEQTAKLAHSREAISLLVSDDFGIPSEVAYQFRSSPPGEDPVPYSQLEDSVIEQLRALAQARFHALAYLCGSLADYDDPISRLESSQPSLASNGLPHLWAPENEDN